MATIVSSQNGSSGDIRKLEEIINGIHRFALGGKTAAQYDAELAMAA